MKQGLVCMVLALISGLAVPTLALAQAEPAARRITLTGKLNGGRIAVGGETSGWEFVHRDKTGEHRIEVEFSPALLAKVRDGQTVKITGTIVDRERVERGKVPTLVAFAVEEVTPAK